MRKAIKIEKGAGFVIKNAARAIQEQLEEIGEVNLMVAVDQYTRLIARKERRCCPSDTPKKVWYISTQYEDGNPSTHYINGRWYYREPSTGKDTLVPGGVNEVVANWVCYFTG